MTAALQERDWESVVRSFRATEATVPVVLDDVMTSDALTALRNELAGHDGWEDHGSALRWNRPDGPVAQRLGVELTRALPALLDGLRITSHWVIAAARGAGIPMHADNATASINIWLTDDAVLPQQTGINGLEFYDVLRPEVMSYADFSSHEFCERYVAGRGGAVAMRVPYRCNRAVLFDGRVMHRSEPVEAEPPLQRRRMNLTYSWDRLEWARQRISAGGG